MHSDPKPTERLRHAAVHGKRGGELMMQGAKIIPDRCSDKDGPNHNPHKLKT